METIKGYIEKIIFRSRQTGFTVFSLETDGVETVCVGEFADIHAGEFMELSGDYVMHPRFGRQFRAETARIIIPEDLLSVERYLGSGAIKGIGTVTARRIIEMFGEDTMRVMEEEPERLAQVKGISRRKAQEIAADMEEKKDLQNVCIFLGRYGIANSLAVKLYGLYDREIYTIIRDNPYQLADEVTGIGFRTADRIAFNAGIRRDSDYRIKACIIYVLQKALEEGHVYLPEEMLKHHVMTELAPETVDGICEVEDQDLERCLMDLTVDSRILIRSSEEEPQIRQIYYSQNYYTELYIARYMTDLNLHADIEEERIEQRIAGIEAKEQITLDDLQRKAVRCAADSGILIITGGPGTGKTTTINSLIRFFEDEGKEILLAAPTGRAAKRMTEATGREAKTIHRMLELSNELTDSSAGARFNRNEENPLEADVIIVDEMSMVDIFLMNALLRAIRPGTRLILVGDADQLPSVGPGNVLKDLIESGLFATVRLEKIFRQAQESEIVVNAHKINRGEPITLRTDSRDFIFIERMHPQAVASAVLALVKDRLPAYVGADIRDIQVLCPMKKGDLGTQRLNLFLQESLNPPEPGKKEISLGASIKLREGDKVMHIRNNYDLEWTMYTSSGIPYDSGMGIFNGDIGVIKTINERSQMMEVVFDDGKHVIYQPEQLEEVTLAYATTIHKAQGSEYSAVVMPLLSGPEILMNRNILYTGVTRARNCVVIVGSAATVHRMVDNIREQRRYSGLKDRLKEVRHRIL